MKEEKEKTRFGNKREARSSNKAAILSPLELILPLFSNERVHPISLCICSARNDCSEGYIDLFLFLLSIAYDVIVLELSNSHLSEISRTIDGEKHVRGKS